MEKTLILIKPDAVQRSIVGKIIERIENTGLKIVGMKMVQPTEELALAHYPLDEKWAKNVFDKTKAAYDKEGKQLEYKDHIDLGKTIQSWLVDFIRESPIIALAVEGPHSIEIVRKMIGSTEPRQAIPGTVRGDFASVDSYAIADVKKRVLRNLVHASDSVENANRELGVWFSESELHNYQKELDKFF